MTPQRFESEELDRESLDYLQTVRANNGRGTPGVFLSEKVAGLGASRLPGCGALVGVFLLLVTPCLLYLLLWNNPFNVAMLITALGFLGGWLVVAWLRCLIGRSGSRYVGHFKYCDPLYLWHGTGRGVWVTPLRGLQEARCKHEYNSDGSYSRSTIHVVLEDEAFDIPVKSERRAELLETYLNEIARDQAGEPTDRGFDALARIQDDEEGEKERVVEAIPKPQKARTSIGWLIRYPLILGLFVLTFFGVFWLTRTWRDESIYASFKDRNPPNLRFYLLDRTNTRHRDEVKAKLKTYHEKAAREIEIRAGEPDMKESMAALVRALSERSVPLITMTIVRDPEKKDKGSMDSVLGPLETSNRTARMLMDLDRVLRQWFKDNMGPAPHVTVVQGVPVMFGEMIAEFAPASGDWAMITIDPHLETPQDRGPYYLIWNVAFRIEKGPPFKTVRWRQSLGNDPNWMKGRYRQMCDGFASKFRQLMAENRLTENERP